MRRSGFALFAVMVMTLSIASAADEPKDAPKDTKDPVIARGFLPLNWKSLGLTDEQKQKIYTLQNKFKEDTDKLELQIAAMKKKMEKERFEILTPEQTKKLEEIMKAKAGAK